MIDQEIAYKIYARKASPIDLDLLIAVVNEIIEDVKCQDYTAIECLFQYLDEPEKRLKGFLREEA